MKPVICVFITEHRNGPIFFGTTSDCKQRLEIDPETEYIFVDIGTSGNEMDCIKESYGKFSNVRFVEISEWYFQRTKMIALKERIEASIFILWHDYVSSKNFNYKNNGYNFLVWTTDKYLDKPSQIISAAKNDPKPILYRSEEEGFSNYGGFMVFNYEMITEEELFNKEKNRLHIL